MKKTMFALLLSLVCFLTSCVGPGLSDWRIVLMNGYELWRVNGSEIIIQYADGYDVEGIPSFIKEFSYDERYVFTRNVDDIAQNNILSECYYILDTEEQIVYGPFAGREEWISQTEAMNLTIPEKWYRTSPEPYEADHSRKQ